MVGEVGLVLRCNFNLYHRFCFYNIKFNVKYENKAKNSCLNTIIIAICSFVGVGFITGAEIWFYFARFGLASLFGFIIFGILIYCVLTFSLCEKENQNLKTKKFKTKILLIGELFVASAMVSGLFEITKLVFGRWWSFVFILSILILIILFFCEKKTYVLYNYILMIFIIFVIVLLFIFNNQTVCKITSRISYDFKIKNILFSCLFSSIYVFSNIAELRPVLEQNLNKFSSKKIKTTCLILSLSLILLAFMLVVQFFINTNLAIQDLPFLSVFKAKGGWFLIVYLVGLVMTMISTAVSCLIGVKNKINFDKKDEKFIKIIVIILLLILGQVSFNIFMKIIYPAIAILNFLVFIFEIFERRKIKKNKKIKL